MDPTSRHDPDFALLARVFANEATEEDRHEFERWRLADGAREALIARLRTVWDRTGTVSADDVDAHLAEIKARIARRQSQRARGFPAASRPLAWAAALILCVGLAGYLARQRAPSGVGPTAEAPTPVTEVATTRGQRAEVQLSDGSRVTLGVTSRLRYPRNFGETTREVELEGEAYFDVVHDERVPFRVRTSHGVTEDVGTKFAVRAYPGETTARVVVQEGKVAVAPEIILAAGDVARVAAGKSPVVQHGVDVDALLSWTNGHLEFVDVPLRDVAADLARWYDVRVEIPDPALARRTVTASFRDASIGDVLGFIARVLDARIEHRDSTRIIVPRSYR